MSELILTRDTGAIRYLTMNRPEKLNAMNDELVGNLLPRCAPPKRIATWR